MSKRPLSITVIGWLFVVFGCVSLAAVLLPLAMPAASGGLAEFEGPLVEVGLVGTVRLAALLGGAFLLRGCNWARWLLVVWMGFHIALSLLHSLRQLVVHSLLFGVIFYILFRPAASAYFRGRAAG